MEWINVEDRLPNEGELVLCNRREISMSGEKNITPSLSKCNKHGVFTYTMDCVYVSHWMPLPQLPE